MTTPTPADDARAIIDNLRRANIAVICHDEAAVAAMVDAHQALRAENEALRAELSRVQQSAKRVMKSLIAGQATLQAERDAARGWARVWKRQARDNWRDARMAHQLLKEASE